MGTDVEDDADFSIPFSLSHPLEHLAFAVRESCFRRRRRPLLQDDQETAALRMPRKLRSEYSPTPAKLGKFSRPVNSSQPFDMARDGSGQVRIKFAPDEARQEFPCPCTPVFDVSTLI